LGREHYSGPSLEGLGPDIITSFRHKHVILTLGKARHVSSSLGCVVVFHGPSYNARATHKDAFLHGPCRHPLPYLPSNRMQARSFSVTHVDHHLQSPGRYPAWVPIVLPR
ncbi:hypothetical protein BHM03_00062723, partial [Ensete ventricosum]